MKAGLWHDSVSTNKHGCAPEQLYLQKTGVRLQFVTPAFEDIQMSKTQYAYMMDKTPTEKMVPKPGLPFPPQAVELPCPLRIN